MERHADKGPAGDDDIAGKAARAWQGLNTLLLERYQQRKAVSEALGMSFSRVRALRRLAAGPVSLRELAERMGSDPPYTTVIVDDLVRRGLAERITNPTDRRSKLVHLTEDGQAKAELAISIITTPPDALLALPREDIEALDRIVAKLLD
ncbi:MarR family winged helix-turn-helix transcriptional regulator [Streptomyces spectabilis]|uniref:MarR family transcriptional regulator n=1 Tax=Streptomyces spectabilis TaxID=68270 RepID=A0A516R2E6_STRST|nr:MarR family transcriptional regulator [Streptomyces spectabilis]QDQ09825.1 MarR family transcriptional regulator [Streptomyces spectabilis]